MVNNMTEHENQINESFVREWESRAKVLIKQKSCVNVMTSGKIEVIATPWDVYFDIEKCEGCTFWWICQTMMNIRKSGE